MIHVIMKKGMNFSVSSVTSDSRARPLSESVIKIRVGIREESVRRKHPDVAEHPEQNESRVAESNKINKLEPRILKINTYLRDMGKWKARLRRE